MKKFLAVFFLVMAANISVVSAAMLRVADVGVNEFVHSMANIIYDEKFQKEIPLLMTNAEKIENSEFPEIGKAAYVCQYGLKTSAAPEGEIIFFVDGEEKVSALKIVGYSEKAAENAGAVLAVSLNALGLTQADAEYLFNNLNGEDFVATSIVWSEEKQRCFVLMAGGRPQAAEGFQFVLMASDKKD